MGASPPSFPTSPDAGAARIALAEVLHRSPRLFGLPRSAGVGLPRSRWWLAGLRQAVAWLGGRSLGGICRLLHRLRLTYRRGRRYTHSPDLAYETKLAAIQAAAARARAEPGRYVLVYEDEVTYYRRPTVAQGYAPVAADAPRADQGLGQPRKWRIAGGLDVVSGRHFAWQRPKFGRHTFARYLRALEASYPDAEHIAVALDNWPVHFHDDVTAALAGSKLELLPLPTYAPWTNPEEKVWRKLYAEVLHLHEFTDRWQELRTVVDEWLAALTTMPIDLLRYVGLLCPD